jgi:DNA (cytosine-5)-methyltransferase 1
VVAARPTFVDLFCGAGGLSLGFHAAGCRLVAAVDEDGQAVATLQHNFSRLQPDALPQVIEGDAGDIEALGLKDPPDILVGGPPCQAFSLIGRAKLNSLSEEGFRGDPRNKLYLHFLGAVERWKPRAVVMENVPGMLSVDGENHADDVAADLAALSYRVAYVLLNAAWFGVPQFRERVFFVGIRRDLGLDPPAFVATHAAELPAGYLGRQTGSPLFLPFVEHFEARLSPARAARPATTVAEGLEDLPILVAHLHGHREDRLPVAPYRGAARSDYALLMRNWPGFQPIGGVTSHQFRHNPRDYETFKRMRPGDCYPEALRIAKERLEERLQLEREAGCAVPPGSDREKELRKRIVPPYPEEVFRQKWRKLDPDRPAWTIPAHLSKDSYSHIHYDSNQARTITIREAARLQSFPDAFEFHGNMGEQFRQVGNAVPPLVAWVVASAVLKTLGVVAVPPW